MSIIILSVTALSILMVSVGMILHENLREDRHKTERFIHSRVNVSINEIKRQLFEMTFHISEIVRETSDTIGLTSFSNASLDYLPEEVRAMIRFIWIGDRSRELEVSILFDSATHEKDYTVDLARLREILEGKFYNGIFMDDFQGVISIPLAPPGSDDDRILVIGCQVDHFMGEYGEYIGHLVESNLQFERWNLLFPLPSFTAEVIQGDKIISKEQDPQFVYFDLSTHFNFPAPQELLGAWNWNGLDQPKDNPIQENGYYIKIGTQYGSLDDYYNWRFLFSIFGMVFLCVIFGVTTFLIVYRSWQIRNAAIREQEFIALTSHELKTPLSVIALGAKNLSSGVIADEDKVREYGEIMDAEAAKLKILIENILMLSTGTMTGEKSEFTEIDEITELLKNDNLNLCRQFEVPLVVTNDSTSEGVLCNAPALILALNNILRNAIYYGASKADDPTVQFNVKKEVRKRREGICFTIIDRGPGIRWSEQQHIFRPFCRGKMTQSESIQGTGLGLSLSRKIAEDHGGTLELLSGRAGATEFALWIPKGTSNETNFDDRR